MKFDFTTDTPGFWDGFWTDKLGINIGNGADPDAKSETLRTYHQLLWSKELPNGEYMNLKKGNVSQYLLWKDYRFGSDSITASFRHSQHRELLEKVEKYVQNYKNFVENYLRLTYTIGGMIIFPKHKNSINQWRGCNQKIKDRWDLTLECIRRFYNNEKSPLYDVLKEDEQFFALFVDFKGYIDYFYLQDCVSEDYQSVHFWLGNGDFDDSPLPRTPEEYVRWIENELDFVQRRNERIHASVCV